MPLKQTHWLSILVQTPVHSKLSQALTYQSPVALAPGALVRVTLGTRELLGVVWQVLKEAPPEMLSRDGKAVEIKPISADLGLTPLSDTWRQFISFAAIYYQRSLGEVALSALPPQLRTLDATQMQRRLKKQVKSNTTIDPNTGEIKPVNNEREYLATSVKLTSQQLTVLADMDSHDGPFLLYGATGSGKTEVYLQAANKVLRSDKKAQVLMMVPEINLTPQLEERVRERFCPLFGDDAVVSMHSGMTNPQRLKSWLAAHVGRARIVLGTRMAIFASMPHLNLIVVDEEHDPSYKSQDGARYSARDLAVYRGKLDNAKVILGSATPSFESWHHSQSGAETQGRYKRLSMLDRVGSSALPEVVLVNMAHQPKKTVVSPPLLAAIAERIRRGEQSIIFLNRRGYAPVLHCADCGWKSECPHCSAYRVFHKIDRTLRCHHCGFTERVPRACPACGNADITPIGRGTEQLEEHLADLLRDIKRPNGEAVRIARIDADSTKLKGALQQQLAQVHAGEVDVLVGTQMIAKGHDFRNITLVAAVNPDTALFSSDFRAPERLFALLMQAAGRAGRDAAQGGQSEMWIQTQHPQHPLYIALKKHDYAGFAKTQLKDREAAMMSPFGYSALVRAEARTQEVAQAFLNTARETILAQAKSDNGSQNDVMQLVSVYGAVPMSMQRIANVERAQMLIESSSRKALQQFLQQWQTVLHNTPAKGIIRWAVDVDPLLI
ncbi:MAG: primosomal protein N' [Polaromonas sp.]|nr:primosomal protein N' [Polaromonas sp.]MBP7308384.1 primosomal protein N' [Polaromonas sp.]